MGRVEDGVGWRVVGVTPNYSSRDLAALSQKLLAFSGQFEPQKASLFDPKRLAFSGSNGHQKASLSNLKRLAFSAKSTAPVHLYAAVVPHVMEPQKVEHA